MELNVNGNIVPWKVLIKTDNSVNEESYWK